MKPKRALVTGGAHRLGLAFALGLADMGADIVINHRTADDDAVARALDAIRARGRRASAVRGDVTDPEQVDALVAACRDELGGLDVVVNSASLFESGRFEEIEAEAWDRVLAVNLKGPFLLSQRAAPLLREGGGLIVNVADLSAFQAWPSYAHHSASKAGLVQLTRVAARALAPDVRVNCIAPGTVLPPGEYLDVETGRAASTSRDASGAALPESDPTGERTVLDRRGGPEDAVGALRYLVEADYVTGQTIVVDGGRMLL